MQQDIFLIGYGQTRFGELWTKDIRCLMDEAVTAALEQSPCSVLDIDLIVVANMLGDTLSGQAHAGSLASSLLPHHPPALRVESACGSGAYAIHTACAMLESGRARTVLVIGAEKMSDASPDAVAEGLMGAADTERDRPSGITFPGIFGLVARRYMHEYGLTREDLSLVSAVHHRNAVQNPFAQFRQEVAPEAVSKSALVSDPLRLLDCSPISDGAAACILSTAFEGPVALRASQIASDALSLADRPTLTSFAASKDASERALAEAGVKLRDIRHLETHDCFSIAAVINLEDLGFADPGTGVEIYRSLLRDPSSAKFTVNGSGGLKGCGHPVAATGVKQCIDIAKQLRTSGQRFGMAHNFGGACATCAVHIFENASPAA